jgi:hypothetical protein
MIMIFEVDKLSELLQRSVVQHFVVHLVCPDPNPDETEPGLQ